MEFLDVKEMKGKGDKGSKEKGKRLVMQDVVDTSLVHRFLTIKNAYKLSQDSKRDLTILNADTPADAKRKVFRSSCELFDFPMGSGIHCSKKSAPKCKDSSREEVVASTKKSALYCGNLLQKLDRSSVIATIDSMKFPLTFTVDRVESIALFKALVGIKKKKAGYKSQEYSVVNWDSDESITESSINEINNLLEKHRGTVDSDAITYVVIKPAHLTPESESLLQKWGFKIFTGVWKEGSMGHADATTKAVMEIALMMDAALFLGFGDSDTNDLVEHERMQSNHSYCITREPSTLSLFATSRRRANEDKGKLQWGSVKTVGNSLTDPSSWCDFDAAKKLKQKRKDGMYINKISKFVSSEIDAIAKTVEKNVDENGHMDSTLHFELMLVGVCVTIALLACGNSLVRACWRLCATLTKSDTMSQ